MTVGVTSTVSLIEVSWVALYSIAVGVSAFMLYDVLVDLAWIKRRRDHPRYAAIRLAATIAIWRETAWLGSLLLFDLAGIVSMFREAAPATRDTSRGIVLLLLYLPGVLFLVSALIARYKGQQLARMNDGNHPEPPEMPTSSSTWPPPGLSPR